MADHDPMQPVGGSPLPPDNQHWRMMLAQAEDDLAKARDAIEALTAKNQRLTDALNTTVQEATTAIDNRLKPEIERLTAENAKMVSEVARLNGQIGAWIVTASKDAFRAQAAETQLRELGAQYLADFGQRYQPESYATTDHGWYTVYRRRVEADHVAKRNAWPRHCHSPSSCTRHQACMYMNCRHEGQDIRQAIADHVAAKDDEAEGLRPLTHDEIEAGSYLLTRAKEAPIRNPLADPEYPALMAEALRQAKDGD